ncbi:hypothetical protein HNR62_000179 [Oceanisphaera litoralis]|nr:hypothetical protein [Oceanisphaera litoralis]
MVELNFMVIKLQKITDPSIVNSFLIAIYQYILKFYFFFGGCGHRGLKRNRYGPQKNESNEGISSGYKTRLPADG